MRCLPPHRPTAATAAVALTLAIALGLTTVAGAASTSSGSSGSRSFPGASGSVAAITGTSMEVQNQLSGQVTVSWTTSTAFTQMVSVPASSVTVGDCVTVSGSTAKKTKVVTAKTVTVSQPATGKCTGALGGLSGGGTSGGGSFPGGGSGKPPSGGSFPGGGSGRPPSGGSFPGGGSGRPRGLGNVGFASGKVTAVTATSMTVSGFSSASLSGSRPSTKGKAKSKRPSLKTTTVKVAVTSSTTYSESQSAPSSALAVGDCVTAAGSSDSTGAVTASTVQITSTGGQSCTTGFFGAGGSGSASA